MKVTAVEARTCVVPLDRDIAFATRAVRERHYTLVRVRTDTGAEGLGFCYGGTRGGALATLAVRELLRDCVVGRDPHLLESIWETMYREALLQGRRGAVIRAIGAIDQALWDAVSREADLPLHRYLGGYREETVPAYASGGYYAENKTPDDLAREVSEYIDLGFDAVKIKVGGVSTQDDALRIAAAREAIGPDMPLFLDANNAWRDASSAIQAVREWEQWSPGWIEEPLMPDDVRGHAVVAKALATPVATGEIHATRWDFLDLIERRAAAVLQPDAGVCGGITEWRRIAALAAAHDITIAPHWLADLHVHLVAATPNAVWVEYFTNFSVLNIGRLFSTAPEIVPGGLALPQSAGLGIELDDKAVSRYAVDDWQ